MRPRVYIAGPISKGDLPTNIRNASETFFRLLRAGFAPFCPHWSAYSGGPYDRPVANHLPCGTSHDDWMGADLPWVAVSDGLLRLPGESAGADKEVEAAWKCGIPVFFRVEDLLEAFALSDRGVV